MFSKETPKLQDILIWLVFSTHLKNIQRVQSFPIKAWKYKYPKPSASDCVVLKAKRAKLPAMLDHKSPNGTFNLCRSSAACSSAAKTLSCVHRLRMLQASHQHCRVETTQRVSQAIYVLKVWTYIQTCTRNVFGISDVHQVHHNV